jgi:hypothetical protein
MENSEREDSPRSQNQPVAYLALARLIRLAISLIGSFVFAAFLIAFA